MPIDYNSALNIQIFREDIQKYGVDVHLKLFPLEGNSLEDIYGRYLSHNQLIGDDSGWVNTLLPPPKIFNICNSSTLPSIDNNAKNTINTPNDLSLQRYFLQHILTWPKSLVRVLIPKNRYEKLKYCNCQLTNAQPPVYRVGSVCKVFLISPTGNSPTLFSKRAYSSPLELANELLVPMIHFAIDFGDCRDDSFPVKFISNDAFTEEEFAVFTDAHGRERPLPINNDEWTEVYHRLLACRSKTSVSSKSGSSNTRLVDFSQKGSIASRINYDEEINRNVALSSNKMAQLRQTFVELQKQITIQEDEGDVEISKEESNEQLRMLRWFLFKIIVPQMEIMNKEIKSCQKSLETEKFNAQKELQQHIRQCDDLQSEIKARDRKLKEEEWRIISLEKCEKENAKLKETLSKFIPKHNEMKLNNTKNLQVVNAIIAKLNLPPNARCEEIIEALNHHTFKRG